MKRIIKWFSAIKVDWHNHVIAFASTILGILIAFQLQNWQEARKEKEKLKTWIGALQTEIRGNRNNLTYGIEKFQSFADYTDIVLQYRKTDSTIHCTPDQWKEIRGRFGTFFDEKLILKTAAEDKLEIPFMIKIDFFPPQIFTDNWEAIKASGVINSMPQDKLVVLMRAYGELSKPYVSTHPDEFYNYLRVHDRNPDLTEINRLATNIAVSLRYKLEFLDQFYETIIRFKTD